MTRCSDCTAGNCDRCDDTTCTCLHTPSRDPWRAWAGMGDPIETEENSVTDKPRVHPQITLTGDKPDSVTHFICEVGTPAEGTPTPFGLQTHHLVPRTSGTGQVHVCRYCKKTEAQLRKELGL